KIPLHDMLVYLRRRKVEAGQGDKLETVGMKGFATVVSSSKRFAAAIRLGQIAQKAVVRKGEITLKLGPLKGWNTYRVAPS
ncbi:amino acid dehydrogenase, partial [Paenibacillus sp. EKM208P]